MTFLGFERVLVLSPHPDDAEYAMSGTAMTFPDTDFIVFNMSNGSKGDRYSGEERRMEVADFWEEVRPDCEVMFSITEFIGDSDEEQWVQDLSVIAENYDAVMVPPMEDSHYEHRLVHHIGWALCRNKPVSLISYATPSTLNKWTPNCLVDVGGVFEKKRGALTTKFPSQQHRAYFKGSFLDTFHRNAQAGKKGLLYVERFRIEEVYR